MQRYEVFGKLQNFSAEIFSIWCNIDLRQWNNAYLLIRIGIWDVLMCAVKGLPQYDSVPIQNVWYERDGCGGEIAAEWLIWVRNIWTFGFGRLLSIGR